MLWGDVHSWTRLGLVLLAGFATRASTARAWDDAPLCALEAPPRLFSLPSAPPPEPEPPMCRPDAATTTRRELEGSVARDAWTRANADTSDAALLALDTVAAAHPRLADLVALRRGEILLARGAPLDAHAAFRAAAESVDSQTRLLAEVGAVRASLQADARGADEALERLLRHHPELPEEAELLLLAARRLEARGATDRRAHEAALSAYRGIDVRFPGSSAGREARRRLLELDLALTDTQRVERAERLVRHGPLDEARAELARLEVAPLHPTLLARVHGLLGRIARHEGRWADAERHLARSRLGAAPSTDEDAVAEAERLADMAAAARARAVADAEAELRRLGYRDAIAQRRRAATARLFAQLRVSSRASLKTQTDAIVEELLTRTLPPGLRVDAALIAVGVADDEAIVRLLDGLEAREGSLGTLALYHRARALERLGRLDEAEAAFLAVRARERERGWYSLWSEQGIASVHAAMVGRSREDAVAAAAPPADAPLADLAPALEFAPLARATELEAPRLASLGVVDERRRAPTPRLEGTADPALLPPAATPATLDHDALADRLAPIVAAHGNAFPWLGRAEDLLRLGDAEEAGRQLYEAFLAWRDAGGRAIRRTGLSSVARGAERPRSFVPFPLKAARRSLDARSRAELIAIGEAIGDYGVSTGFGGIAAVEALPRAYEAKVEAAARRHGLDPNLLFAVMRVESVYQREIISYAGAIGLCQIMPRTGALIASAKGDADYTTAWLLDPDVNLDYAAWYLRSLIERFEGHLPLAIASYNGGPHNVRRWLRDRPATMPMEAFLEHIPFDQTHRYVRRVLGYYAAYRAQQGLPMITLSTELPQPDADRVGF
jgi:soluble lytic murein transglycosylase